MDYGWDTSDEEGGMAIDLDAKQEEHANRPEGTIVTRQKETKNYDPSEPTEDYDPAEPTHDEETSTLPATSNTAEEPPEYDPAEPTLSDDEEENIAQPGDDLSNSNSQHELVPTFDSENKVDDCESSYVDSSLAKECEENNEEKSLDAGDVPQSESPMMTGKSVSESPSVGLLDTDDNTQNSVIDDMNSDVPDVSFDESDFVLEKEIFAAEREAEQNTWPENQEEEPAEADTINEEELEELPQEDQERFRRQEEVDSRNEEALVDLFREESDPERIEDEVEQPVKKVKKKVGTKKIKKKGKKVKKGLGKKGQKKHNTEVEDQRFVELRRDRTSVESIEEGELDGEGHSVGRRKSFDDRLSSGAYEQAYDVSSGHVDEPREPGEIVEESRKRSTKKKEKREKKKKKSKREVATIEEGAQGDEDSQKFPSFLAGFFVQDEGEEELDENVVMSRSFDNGGESFPKTGVKNYRKRHSSGAEDSVKSFEQLDTGRGESQESDHRKSRKHEERRQEVKETRQREARDSREVRHEHRHGTPRTREREREREKARSDRERERVREKERENREREREREVVRDRTRRVEIDERRRRHTRSESRERRRRSASTERVRRSRSRDRTNRHRRHRTKSRERSIERERERGKRKHRERSNEREPERRVRRQTHSRSKSPQRRSERASSNKENRDDTYRRRRRHMRTAEDSDVEDRESVRRSQRRQRRERARSTSTSSSSDSTSDSNLNVRPSHHHRRGFRRSHSSDEGASSDVILVEPERIVINLDEEEDPPSRVDITHHNIDDDSTKLVDGMSIPPPPELSRNARGSALIQINPAEPDNDLIIDEPEGDATPTRDEHTDSLIRVRRKTVPESDYDPAHPTEEPEEHDHNISVQTLSVSAPSLTSSPVVTLTPAALATLDAGPVPPDHPPPEEVRPSPPPVPSLSEPSHAPPPQPMMFSGGLRPQMALLNSQYQQQPSSLPPTQQPSPQHQPGLLPFPGAPPGQNQRFPPWPHVNGPNPNIMHQNAGPPGFVPGQRGLLPTPDTRPLFQIDNSRLPPFATSLMSQPPPPRETMPLLNAPVRQSMPMSAMAPLAQLTSLLPGLDRGKMAQLREDQQIMPPQQPQPQMFKQGLSAMPTSLMNKGPLMSNSTSNNMSSAVRVSRSGRGGVGDLNESTEVVDMDMSPGEDDCELELPSPNSSDSERDDRRRRGRRSNRTANDITKTVPIGDKGVIQPAAYLKALSKVIEKLAPKGHPTEPGSVASQEKFKSKKQRMDVNDDDVPTSAVELTNKEKFLKKLHLQERVIDEVKLAIKPYYSSKKITKEQYKLILRKAVPKVCHSKSGNINPQKIQQLVEAYVNKLGKTAHPSGKKRKGHQPKEATGPKDGPGTTVVTGSTLRQNGERAKKVNR